MLRPRVVRQLYALHKWTALLTGVVILFLSLTGAVAVFREEIDRAITPAKVVTPGASRVPLQRALDATAERWPGSSVANVQLSAEPDAAITLRVRDGRVSREVFVNPYTGAITGSRTGETAHNVIRQLHARFYVGGVTGRILVGAFGVTLLVSCLTGLLIYGRFLAGRHWWSIRRGRLQLAISDWHKLVGILTLLFNVAIAFTGAVLGLELLAARLSDRAQEALHPGPRPELRRERPATLEGMVSIDSALAQARRALPGVTVTAVLMPVERRSHWRMYGDARGGRSAEGTSWVMVHTQTGAVLDAFNGATARGVTRAYQWMEPVHFGSFGGPWVRVLWFLLGLASGGLAVMGYVLWALKRRKTRGPWRRSAAEVGAEARAVA